MNYIFGTYIGCIQIDNQGNLITVETINPLCQSIDTHFEDLVKNTWMNEQVKILNPINDSLVAIYVPVYFTLAEGTQGKCIKFYRDKTQMPNFLTKEITIVGWGSGENIVYYKTDKELLTLAKKYHQKKKFKKCIKSLNELIRRNPYSSELIYMRAKSLEAIGKETESIRDYKYLKYFLEAKRYKKLTTYKK